ncbi:MAG: PqqD family protein [Thermodesulfobacteriota bacterium]|nr:PqqD family protein [Thermodesulfobacteriota bacterium]
MDTALLNRLKDIAISDSGFIFDPYSGATFNTNETGRFILQLLKEGNGIDAIQSEIRKHFKTSEEDLRSDIYEFINLLMEAQLLPKSFQC